MVKGRNLPNIRSTLFVVVLVMLASVTYSQQSVYDIIRTDSCMDIKLLEEPKLYAGDDLFSLINGGAEVYHEYGFVEVLACKMRSQVGSEVRCEIYDMGSPESAWGIYSFTATTNAVPFHAGVAGRSGEGYSQVIKDRFMLYLHYDSIDGFDLQYLAGCLGQNIERYIPQPELMRKVSAGDDDPLKTLYFRGNLGLSSVYSFHYKDVFGIEEGAAAIYDDRKVLLLKYDNEAECRENFHAAKDFFMNSSKYHDQATLKGSFHMKDRKEQQIDCYFENTFLVIFISSGKADLNPLREKIVGSMQDPVTGDR